jgi:transporter family protein
MLIFLITIVIICWGVWGFAEKMALKHGTPWQTLFASLVFKTVFSLPVIFFIFYLISGSQGFIINSSVWLSMLGAVLVNGVAIILIRFALQKGGAGIIIALTAIYPVVTTILAFIFLGEYLSLYQIAGVAITTLGVIFLNF